MKPIIYLKNAWELFYDEDSHEIVFEKKDSGGNSQRKISYELPTDIWTQLSVSRKEGNLTFYVNGVSVGSPIPDDSIYENSDQLLIGKSEEIHFKGFIEQLKIAKTSEYNCDFKPHDFDKFTNPQTELCLRLEDNYMDASGCAEVDQINKTDPSLISTFGNNGSDNVSLTNTPQLKDNFTIAFQLKLEQPSEPRTATILHFGDSNSQLKILDLKTELATSGQKLVLSYIDSSGSEHSFETTSFTSNGGFRSIKLIGDITSNTISIYADGVLIGSKSDYTGLIKSRGTFPDLQNILANWQYNNPRKTMTNNGGYGENSERIGYPNFTISGLKRLFLPSHSTHRGGTSPCENLFAGKNWSMFLKYHGAVQIVLHFKEPITIPKGATPFGCFNGGSGSTVGYGTNGHTPSRGVEYGNCLAGGRTYKLNPQSWISAPATQDIENVNYILSGVLAGACNSYSSCYVTRFGFDKLLFNNGTSENDDYYNLLYSELTIGHPASHNPSDWSTPSEAVSFVGELKNISITDSVLTELDCVVCDYKSIPPTPTPTPTPTPSPVPCPSPICIRVTSGATWMQGTYERFEISGAEYYATYDINSTTNDLLANNLHRVVMNSMAADGMPGHWTISFPDFPDKYIAHSEFYELSSSTEATRCILDATEFRYVIYVQDDQLPPNEVATEYISTIQVTSAECELECGCDYDSNEYLIQSGNTSPAVDTVSAEWQRDFGGKLCFGDIEHGTPRTYVAYIGSDTNPVGTITITGDAYLPSQLTYYDALGNCYTAIPTIENGTDVYRFQSVITSTTTPTPTPTPTPMCCNPTANEYQVDTSQQPQFVATGITLMSFAYNGNLCLGNSTGGLPKSISLYVSGYSDAIGVISVLGDLNFNEISLEVTDDIYLSEGVPSLIGKCMKGNITNDRCDLTEN